MPLPTETDTCRTYVVPRLHAAGWEDEQIREQVTFTDGRIVPIGGRATRKKQKRADYVLRDVFRYGFGNPTRRRLFS